MRLYNYLNEQKEAQEGVTTEAEGLHKEHYHDNHYHEYKVDENGNGETTSTIEGEHDHVHEIENWEVKKAHNHTHELNTHHNKDNGGY